jgi:hypothetical protein
MFLTRSLNRGLLHWNLIWRKAHLLKMTTTKRKKLLHVVDLENVPLRQGDQMSLPRISPKWGPTHYWSKLIHTFTKEKSCPKHGQILQFSLILPTVKNRPLGDNSPNLVALFSKCIFSPCIKIILLVWKPL